MLYMIGLIINKFLRNNFYRMDANESQSRNFMSSRARLQNVVLFNFRYRYPLDLLYFVYLLLCQLRQVRRVVTGNIYSSDQYEVADNEKLDFFEEKYHSEDQANP